MYSIEAVFLQDIKHLIYLSDSDKPFELCHIDIEDKYEEYSPSNIRGRMENGILELELTWGEKIEYISYSGRFTIWWAERIVF